MELIEIALAAIVAIVILFFVAFLVTIRYFYRIIRKLLDEEEDEHSSYFNTDYRHGPAHWSYQRWDPVSSDDLKSGESTHR